MRPASADGPVVDKDYEVPAVGWMWDPSSAKSATTARSLKKANIKAKKSLGQNFCTDDRVLANIVAAARVAAGDAVIEVGPGTGNLTRHLLSTQAHVLAVEKDDTLIERLRDEFKQEQNLQLVHGDVLQLNLQELIDRVTHAAEAVQQQQQDAAESSSSSSSGSSPGQEAQSPQQRSKRRKVKVVANLPYNITKDFLVAMFPTGDLIAELSIMIQEEVAQRLCDATPGRPDYRAMSIITHFYSKPVYRFKIPKEKYFPVPGVDGALVTFKLLPPAQRLQVPDERGFISLVKKAFSERRKMLRNTLQPLYTSQQVEAALTAGGIRVDARAQDLSPPQFAALHQQLHEAVVSQLQ